MTCIKGWVWRSLNGRTLLFTLHEVYGEEIQFKYWVRYHAKVRCGVRSERPEVWITLAILSIKCQNWKYKTGAGPEQDHQPPQPRNSAQCAAAQPGASQHGDDTHRSQTTTHASLTLTLCVAGCEFFKWLLSYMLKKMARTILHLKSWPPMLFCSHQQMIALLLTASSNGAYGQNGPETQLSPLLQKKADDSERCAGMEWMAAVWIWDGTLEHRVTITIHQQSTCRDGGMQHDGSK